MMKLYLFLLVSLLALSMGYGQDCSSPPVITVPDTVYACVGTTGIRVDVTLSNPENFAGTPLYFLTAMGENNPVSPTNGWVSFSEDENMQLYFTENFTEASLGKYNFSLKVRYSDALGCESDAVVFSLVVESDPAVMVFPLGATLCAGGFFSLKAISTGSDCTLQWQERINEQWRDLDGETDDTLSLGKSAAGVYAFRALVTECGGGFDCDAVSETYEVTVLPDPVIMIRAPFEASCTGGTIPLLVDMVNGKDNCLFQWQEYLNNNWVNLPGERDSVLSIRKSEAGTYLFRVKVLGCDDGDDCEATSDTYELIVNEDPIIQINTLQDVACVDGTLRLFATVSDFDGACQLQWQEMIDDQWLDLENANSDVLIISKGEPGRYRFRVLVVDCTDGKGCDAVSDYQELTFLTDPLVSIQTNNNTTCAGGILQIDATVLEGQGICQTGWEEFVEGNWVVINGEEATSLLVSKSIAGTYRFRSTIVGCSVGGGCEATSDSLELIFTPDPVVIVSTDIDTACVGGNVRLEAFSTEVNAICQWQWQELIGEEWIDLLNANRKVLFVNKMIAGSYFYRVIQRECENNSGCDAISDPFEVTFEADPEVQISVEEITACVGGVVELTAITTDEKGACSFQWEKLVGNNWIVLPGASGETLQVSKDIVGEFFYRAQIRNCTKFDGCTAISQPVQLVFEEGPSVSVSTFEQGVCAGGSIQLVANVEGGYGACQYQWQEFTAGIWEDLPDADASMLRVNKENAGTYSYRVNLIACEGNDGCWAVSPEFDVVFAEDPTIQINGNQNFCEGEVVELMALTTISPDACNLQWQEWSNGVWRNLVGKTTQALSLVHEQHGVYTYRVQVIGCDSGNGCNANSEPFEITVIDNSATQLLPSREEICIGTNISFTTMIAEGETCTQVKYFIKRQNEDEAFTEAVTKDADQPFNMPADLPPAYLLSPAIYTIRAELICTTGSCSDFAESTLLIREEPVIRNEATSSVCSEEAIGTVLSVQNPDVEGVLEVKYRIVAINSAGLTVVAGDPYAAMGILSDDRVISDDAWLNTSEVPVVISYAIIPSFKYGDDEFCEGAVKSIEILIEPKPELAVMEGSSICSGNPIGLQLTTQVSGNEERIYYLINKIDSNGLAAVSGAPKADANQFNDANVIADDTWKNTGKTAVDVIYTIQPVFENEVGIFCFGVEKELRVSIKPAPVLSPEELITRCSAGENGVENHTRTAILLQVDNDPDLEGNESPSFGTTDQVELLYRLVSVEAADLEPGLANAQPGEIGGNDLLWVDTWRNIGKEPAMVNYWVIPIAIYNPEKEDECISYGEAQQVSLVVMPAPSVEVALNITGVDYPGSGVCDNFDMLLDVEICNNGQVDVNNLGVKLDLDSLSNGIVTGISKSPFYISGQNFDEVINIHFDGDQDKNLFIPSTTILEAGDCMGYRLQIEVEPDIMAPDSISGAMFLVSATAQGDWSVLASTGFDFYEDLSCYTQSNQAEAVVGECWELSRGVTANGTLEVSLDENCQVILTTENFLTGYQPACNREGYPLGGFHRFQLVKPGGVNEAFFSELILNADDFSNGSATILIEPVFETCQPFETQLLLETKAVPAFGAFDTLVTGIQIIEVDSFIPLWCMDLDSFLFKASSTTLIPGPPVFYNCMSAAAWFEDELFSNGECGNMRIRRTWRVRDQAGVEGAPVVQTIQFSRPEEDDIILPADSLLFKCDELSTEMLGENGYPLPAITGYPAIASVFGIRFIDEEICNIGAAYRDIDEIQVCEDRKMITREWMVVDSCGRGGQNEIRFDTLVTFQQVVSS